jgi:UDP-N-acetylglucosamine 2-epimerase (non-hydrolysing)
MTHVLVVFGTRPEAIKLCPLVLELQKHESVFRTTVCVTSQHREMLDQVLEIFGVTPDHDLDIMRHNQSLSYITSACLTEIGEVIDTERPDTLVVQGDTTTTFAAALAAYYRRIPVGHVEAGLRTFDKYSPFPEEINRRLTSAIAEVHFAPTDTNRANLLNEGVSEDKILVTGNTVIDALLLVRTRILEERPSFPDLAGINLEKKVILVTGHRRENFGERFGQVLRALRTIAERNEDVEIVYPVHLNPNVREPARERLSGVSNIKLIEPVDYKRFVYLMDCAHFLISDSGGVQEEAPSLGKPVLVTRDTTERPEAVEAGGVLVVGTYCDRIVSETDRLLRDTGHYEAMSNVQNPYGDGRACERIVDFLSRLPPDSD